MAASLVDRKARSRALLKVDSLVAETVDDLALN